MILRTDLSQSAPGLSASRAERRAELGWRLQIVRAAIWEAAATGDEYCHLLLDAHENTLTSFERLLAGPACVRSLSGSMVVTRGPLAHQVLTSPSWGIVGRDGKPALQQAMRLPGAGFDVMHGAAGDCQAKCTLGAADGKPDAELADAIDVAADTAVDYAFHAGPRPVDIRALSWRAAADIAKTVVGIDAELFRTIMPDLAPALDALMSPQKLDTARTLLHGVSHLRLLLRESGIDPDRNPSVMSGLLAWAAVADGAVLRVLAAALAAREGVLVQGHREQSADIAAIMLREQPLLVMHARVALEETRVGAHDVYPGDQVVVLDGGTKAGGGLMAAAGGSSATIDTFVPWFAAAVARRIVRKAGPGAQLRRARARRAPVTRRWAVATLEEGTGSE